jgi:hypothetical protein
MREASRHRRTLSALPLLSWRKLAALLSFFLCNYPVSSRSAPYRTVRHRRVRRSQSAETVSRVCFCFAGVSSVLQPSCSTERNSPYDDEDVKEDQRYYSVPRVSLLPLRRIQLFLGCRKALTPHQRPYRVYEIDRFRFDACAVLRAAAEGGLVLCCVAPADCVV